MPQTSPLSSPRAERARDEKSRVRRRDVAAQERDDLRALLRTEQGRRIAARVLHETNMHLSAFSNNAMVMANNAGKNEIGLWFAAQLRAADQDLFFKMQTENDSNA